MNEQRKRRSKRSDRPCLVQQQAILEFLVLAEGQESPMVLDQHQPTAVGNCGCGTGREMGCAGSGSPSMKAETRQLV